MAWITSFKDNLIVNGDFEDHEALTKDQRNGDATFDFFETIPGWVGVGGDIEVHDGDIGTGNSVGNSVVELDSDNNYALTQEVDVQFAGTYEFSIDHSIRGEDLDTNGFEVYIDGELVQTVTPTETGFETTTFDVYVDAGPATVEIVGAGESDEIGTVVDNVSLSLDTVDVSELTFRQKLGWVIAQYGDHCPEDEFVFEPADADATVDLMQAKAPDENEVYGNVAEAPAGDIDDLGLSQAAGTFDDFLFA